jgi:hypothetical protein
MIETQVGKELGNPVPYPLVFNKKRDKFKSVQSPCGKFLNFLGYNIE